MAREEAHQGAGCQKATMEGGDELREMVGRRGMAEKVTFQHGDGKKLSHSLTEQCHVVELCGSTRRDSRN